MSASGRPVTRILCFSPTLSAWVLVGQSVRVLLAVPTCTALPAGGREVCVCPGPQGGSHGGAALGFASRTKEDSKQEERKCPG